MKKQIIVCECGAELETSDKPNKVTCRRCKRQYQRQAPKLMFLGAVQEHFPAGTVII